MIPTRQKLIGENKVEEYYLPRYWGETAVVYVGGKEVAGTFDQAVERLETGE